MTTPSRRLFLAAGSAGAVFGALSAAASQEVASLVAAIDRHKQVYAAFENISGTWGRTQPNDPDYGAIYAEWKRLDEAEADAMDAVCRCPVGALADARVKAEYLVAHLKGAELTERQYRAVLQAFLV
ncbi:hypothetical protein ACNHKD_04295 [Methylocystis sp. JAN1]|uniref:hypothetical protein n=1 Tax=Methylocystis sp. JAN1 TaxID=3397211 RepID=UPI003FA293CF